MPRQNTEFKTYDRLTLRDWLYTPSSVPERKLPYLVISHGFSTLKKIDLDKYADDFTSKLHLTCLVYNNRGLGSNKCATG